MDKQDNIPDNTQRIKKLQLTYKYMQNIIALLIVKERQIVRCHLTEMNKKS